MVDRDTILQVLCSLMKKTSYLSETDKYHLSIEDFPTAFDRYIFSAIYNLYKDGAETVSVVDIDNYFNTHATAKKTFEREKGIEYLQDGLDFNLEENFPFYYKRLKKFNCLKDIKKLGFDTEQFYCEDLTNPKAKEINDRFEEMDVSDIFDQLRHKIMGLETEYSVGDASETATADKGIDELLSQLRVQPEIGANLQGDIFNTICRGARKSKFYIRSASSGTGKTRAAVGDACYVSYPIRYNWTTCRWEYKGSSEKSLFIATEQSLDEIQTLILSYISGVNEEKLLQNTYDEMEREIIEQAALIMKKYSDNLRIVRLSNPSIEQIKAVVRQNWLLYEIENVFYDYIFSSPSLLNEFRDLRIREDVALGMLSTALKDIAVELNVFVMSSTQTNSKSDDDNGKLKNESVIRGSRAIIDKCDIACVISKVSQEDLEALEGPIKETGHTPNQVLDIYKVRRGRYNNVKVWSEVDLGTCRKEDIFITDVNFKLIDFQKAQFMFDEDDADEVMNLLKDLNNKTFVLEDEQKELKVNIDGEVIKENSLEMVEEKEKEAKGLFGDLM